MTNNEIIKRIRYIFDYSDEQMMAIFESADYKVTRSLVTDWLKNEDHDEFKEMGVEQIRALGKPNHVLYDVKHVFNLNESDIRL